MQSRIDNAENPTTDFLLVIMEVCSEAFCEVRITLFIQWKNCESLQIFLYVVNCLALKKKKENNKMYKSHWTFLFSAFMEEAPPIKSFRKCTDNGDELSDMEFHSKGH